MQQDFAKTTLLAFIFTILIAAGCNDNKSGSAVEVGTSEPASKDTVLVEIMALEKKPFRMELISNGKLRAASKSAMYFGTEGTIADVLCKNGEYVRKGQLLAYIGKPELGIELNSAEAEVEKAKLEYLDVLAGQGYGNISDADIPSEVKSMARTRSGLNTAENQLAKVRLEMKAAELYAPFNGRISGLKLKRYERYSTGEPFCSVIDDSSFDVEFKVIESEYSFLEKGMKVKASPFSDKSLSLEGRLSEISPEVDKQGQITVFARMAGGNRFIDGMNVQVIAEKVMPASLVVPKSAVLNKNGRNVVFVYGKDGLAHWVYVDIVNANSNQYAIEPDASKRAKLNEGDEVIFKGNITLADLTPVKVTKY